MHWEHILFPCIFLVQLENLINAFGTYFIAYAPQFQGRFLRCGDFLLVNLVLLGDLYFNCRNDYMLYLRLCVELCIN